MSMIGKRFIRTLFKDCRKGSFGPMRIAMTLLSPWVPSWKKPAPNVMPVNQICLENVRTASFFNIRANLVSFFAGSSHSGREKTIISADTGIVYRIPTLDFTIVLERRSFRVVEAPHLDDRRR
jgi:hypothetical protein